MSKEDVQKVVEVLLCACNGVEEGVTSIGGFDLCAVICFYNLVTKVFALIKLKMMMVDSLCI